ncbi:MAG: hypothetical protein Q8L87_08360, partial [Anaerolineales bacterium]|nr:hypothetical protein [Anaerolineales bacterium]
MHKLQFVILLAFFAQACSPGTPAPTSTLTLTPSPVQTFTPSLTPSITPSPTIVRIPTQDFFQPQPTPFEFQLFIGSVTVTPFATPGSTRPGAGFASVDISEKKIYWGGCKYNSTTITTQVDDPEEVFSVIIFTRVMDMEDKDELTPWTSGNVLFNNRDGTFTVKLRGSEIQGHNHYKKSWVLFQLVATNIKG